MVRMQTKFHCLTFPLLSHYCFQLLLLLLNILLLGANGYGVPGGGIPDPYQQQQLQYGGGYGGASYGGYGGGYY